MRCASSLWRQSLLSRTNLVRYTSLLAASDRFLPRHLGTVDPDDLSGMLRAVGVTSLDHLVQLTVPKRVQSTHPMKLPVALSESELTKRLGEIMDQNHLLKTLIGEGYTGTLTPAPIQRSILESPLWYTQYTPYQPEISQGRLESLLNFQTMVADLTELPVANASLLDEATAAAEAMGVCFSHGRRKRRVFFIDQNTWTNTKACVRARAAGFGVTIVEGDWNNFDFDSVRDDLCGALVQYPDSRGAVNNLAPLSDYLHSIGAELCVASDLLALTVLTPPGAMGADVCIGSSQRFGVQPGYGGPYAAFFACAEKHKRKIPGRLVGVSRDADGKVAYRLALQTREQHIRREKATSNICTAQALLANIAAMYGVYHGPEGLKNIAMRIHRLAATFAQGVKSAGFAVHSENFFDTVIVDVKDANQLLQKAREAEFNLRHVSDKEIGITMDETVTVEDLDRLLTNVFGVKLSTGGDTSVAESIAVQTFKDDEDVGPYFPTPLRRATQHAFMTHPVFNSYHSETELLRYIRSLQGKDLSLADSMIPLGSCTMKLNAATEMVPITWPKVAQLHPFVPADQAKGYAQILKELRQDLCEITGFSEFSLQPNSGAQGEYTGLRVIRAYHTANGDGGHRDVCLIPVSAHGTNPASAAMAGLEVAVVNCHSDGRLDIDDLQNKADKFRDRIASIMVTYPSTYGVFEEGMLEACDIVHRAGGQVYMDGANMNAQVGICRPAEIGADVCHLNLHKTFCIPHGGGGPGAGPIGVREHLVPFLPGHPFTVTGDPVGTGSQAIGPVSGAPYGSASILPISWAYIRMMGGSGLRQATEMALLNANYMKARLSQAYKVLYVNENGMCAHEFIVDIREFSSKAGVEAIDLAKRLQDYGFHAPTMSWPVPGSLMIEPTESESKRELDRFCDALLQIREEIRKVETGEWPREDNPLCNAPHTMEAVTSDTWNHVYSREVAAWPAKWLRDRKFWPAVGRVDDAFGDRNLVTSACRVQVGEFDTVSAPSE